MGENRVRCGRKRGGLEEVEEKDREVIAGNEKERKDEGNRGSLNTNLQLGDTIYANSSNVTSTSANFGAN